MTSMSDLPMAADLQVNVVNPMFSEDGEEASESAMQAMSPNRDEASDCAQAMNHLFLPANMQPSVAAFMGHPVTEWGIVIIILINSFMLAAISPNDRPTDGTTGNTMLQISDYSFTLVYTAEAVLRIMANGAFRINDQTSETGDDTGRVPYFCSGWTRLDFFVLSSAYVSYIFAAFFGGKLKTSIFRALRVLRVLKGFQFFAGIRAIITSLGRAIGLMSNVLLMFVFIFTIYSIVGHTLYSGVLRVKCVSKAVAASCNANATANAAPDVFMWGGDICESVPCPSTIAACPAPNVCQITRLNPRGGYAGYDNLAASLLTLIVATTSDNWQDITYMLTGSVSTAGSVAYTFMMSILVFLSMIALNIFVAIISSTFADVRGDQQSAFSEEEKQETVETATVEPTKDTEDGSEDESKVVDLNEISWSVPRPPGWIAPAYQSDAVEILVQHPVFDNCVTFSIIANTVCLAMVHHNMSAELTNTLDVFEIVFTVLFWLEMITKICALGFKRFLSVKFNRLDFVVNVLTLGVLLVPALRPVSSARVLRIARLLFKVESLRVLLEVVLGSWTAVLNLCLFIVYLLFVFSVFGMHMMGDMEQFNDLYSFVDEGTASHAIPRPLFDNFFSAFTTSFVMMTGDRWKVTMYTYMQSYGPQACIYFILLWVICSCIMLNLFIAVILENFSLAEEEKMEKQKLKWDVDHDDRQINRWRIAIMRLPGPKQIIEKVEKGTGEMGRSWFIFGPENPFRSCCVSVVSAALFEYFILFLIMISSVMIAYEGPQGSLDLDVFSVFQIVDKILLCIFWLEFFVRTVANGFVFTQDSYISDHWNKLDFAVILMGTLGYVFSDLEDIASLFRLGRLLRPLRLLNKIEGMKVILAAIIQSIPSLFGVCVLGFVFYTMFAILAVTLFGGKLFRCDNDDVFGRLDCVGSYGYADACPPGQLAHIDTNHDSVMDSCWFVGKARWHNPGYSFDNIGSALKTLFLVGTTAGWSDCLYNTMDITAVDIQPARDASTESALFFIAFIFICSFATLNLFVGVLIYLFGMSTGTSLQTEVQMQWIVLRGWIKHTAEPKEGFNREMTRPDGFRGSVYDIIVSEVFERIINFTIVFNILVMLCNYFPEPDGYKLLLEVLNAVCLFVFTIEAILKNIGLGFPRYVRDHWNKLDLFVVFSSLLFMILGVDSFVQVARCLRVFRIVLLLKTATGLRQIIKTILTSLPAAGNIAMLLFLQFFMYACLGMYIFGNTKLGANYDTRGNFRDFPSAMKLLLQVATGEDFLLMNADLEVMPPMCTAAGTPGTAGSMLKYGDCGSSYAFPFLATFYSIANFLLLNMIIAVIMENFEHIKTAEGMEVDPSHLQRYADVWRETVVDQGNTTLSAKELSIFLKNVGAPLGAMQGERPNQFADKVLFRLEGLWGVDAEKGIPFRDLLKTLAVMHLGGPACLSYDELKTRKERSARHRSATVVICAVKAWRAQRGEARTVGKLRLGEQDGDAALFAAARNMRIRSFLRSHDTENDAEPTESGDLGKIGWTPRAGVIELEAAVSVSEGNESNE